jgi:glycosyltransferase involved in cell wall biosynthesis
VRPRIAFIDHYYGEHIGGGEEYLLLAATGVRGRGFAPVVICLPDSALAREARARGLDVVEVPFFLPNLLAAPGRLAAALEELDPHILNAHGYWSTLAARFALRHVPRARMVATVHAEVLPEHERGVRKLVRSLRNTIDLATSDAIRYVAVSKTIAAQLERIGIDRERIAVINPALPEKTMSSLIEIQHREPRVDDGALVFGSAGRLVPVKGFDVLIRAFADVRRVVGEVSLVIFGEGPEREKLRALAGELGVADCVSFPGYKSREEIYRTIDVYVSASRTEGFPVALIEASVAGLPVICTAAGGQTEIVAHEETGLVVPPEDASELARAMMRLALDGETRRRLGEAARAVARERFSEERFVEEHVQLFEELAQTRSA